MAGTNTSRLSLYKPDPADDINVDTDINANLNAIDLNIGYRVCTSSTRPSSPFVGQTIYETDTGDTYYRNNSTTWVKIFTASTTLLLDNTNNASLSSTGHALQIGPTSGINLIADNDSLVARNNGAASTLSLNVTGGNITIGSSASAVTIAGSLSVGGVGFPFMRAKASDETVTSSTTVQGDNELTMSLAGSSTYFVEFNLMFSALAAGDIKTQWAVPSGASGTRTCIGPGSTATVRDNISGRFGSHSFSTDVAYGCESASLFSGAYEYAVVTTTTAGTLTLNWAQASSSATASTMRAGSTMRVTKLS